MTARTPDGRRRLLVSRIVSARQANGPTCFESDGVAIEYDNRILRLELATSRREQLETLLDSYHVFKIKQPETRKAEDGVVYVSAVTDAKHAADFIEALFRELYGFDEGYELRATGIE